MTSSASNPQREQPPGDVGAPTSQAPATPSPEPESGSLAQTPSGPRDATPGAPVTCPSCGASVAAGVRRCPACGTRIPRFKVQPAAQEDVPLRNPEAGAASDDGRAARHARHAAAPIEPAQTAIPALTVPSTQSMPVSTATPTPNPTSSPNRTMTRDAVAPLIDQHCSRCGQPLDEGTMFCGHCGAPTSNAALSPRNATSEHEEQWARQHSATPYKQPPAEQATNGQDAYRHERPHAAQNTPAHTARPRRKSRMAAIIASAFIVSAVAVVVALFATGILSLSGVQGGNQENMATRESDTNGNKAASSLVGASDPRIVADTSMDSGQTATWDCVWLGSYPQSEVKPSDAEYASLEDANWDNNGDATVGSMRYRRISKSDATYSDYWSDDGYGSNTYRYFRWEPVKWRVLEVNGTTALVMSDVALDDQCYNTNYAEVTWETSSVRSWLNGYGASSNEPGTDYSSKSFLSTAFSTAEQAAVLETAVVNTDNKDQGTDGGIDTTDRVFLLSENEAYANYATRHGFKWDTGQDMACCCEPSDYAHAMGASRSADSDNYGNCEWWLRSPGFYEAETVTVSDDGWTPCWTRVHHVTTAVRPALTLDLTSPLVHYAGTVSSNGDVDEKTVNQPQDTAPASELPREPEAELEPEPDDEGEGEPAITVFKAVELSKVTAQTSFRPRGQKGTYKLKVKVTAAGDANHEAATKTVTARLKVK